MTNFKGEGTDFTSSKKNTPRSSPINPELHPSQSPQINRKELPRPQSANELRNVFISNQLDQIQPHDYHESQQDMAGNCLADKVLLNMLIFLDNY